MLVRRAWRTGWRSHAVLLAVTAASVAAVMAVVIGAGRAESALDRLRTTTRAADLDIQLPAGDVSRAKASVAAADGVTAVGTIRELFVRPRGSEHFPDYDLLSVAPGSGPGAQLDGSVIVEGRRANERSAREVTLSEGLARQLRLGVGDTIELESMSDAWVDAAFNGGDPGPPDGPLVKARVVGLARSAADFGRFVGVIHLTSAFADRYEREIRTYALLEARLSPAAAGATKAFDIPGAPKAEVQPSFFAHSAATQDGLRTIATAFRLIGLTAGLAGLTAAGLSLVRLARLAMADRPLLVAVGFTRAQLVRATGAVLAPWVGAGMVVGALAGVLVSPVVSLGLARAVDPVAHDLVVPWGSVAAVSVGAVVLAVLLLAWSAARAGRSPARARRDGWAVPVLRRPLAAPLGLRRALFGGAERGGRVSRSATAAATAGVAVAVGALLVGTSIQHLQDDPRLSGQGALDQRVVDAGEDPTVFDRALAMLEADDRVADLIGVHVAFGVHAKGVGELTALIYDVRRGSLGAVIMRGRAPAQPDEVAIGPRDLKAMGRTVGDEVALSSEAGSARFRIVGVALFPEGDFSHDSGVALTVDGAQFLGGPEAWAIHQVAFSWAPGVDVAAADRSLVDAGFRPFTTEEGLVPAVVSNLGQVRSLPRVLAGLVLVLALATSLHAMSLTARQRRVEAGTLRALGMTPRSVAAVVLVHGAAMVVVAVGAGLPLGAAAGRVVWTAIADRANVIDRPVMSWTALGLATGGLLAATLLLALPAVVSTLRLRPAAALRAE